MVTRNKILQGIQLCIMQQTFQNTEHINCFFLASSTKRNLFENFDKKMFGACIDWTHDSEMYKKNI